MINYSIVMRSVNANLLEINQAKSRINQAKKEGKNPDQKDLDLVKTEKQNAFAISQYTDVMTIEKFAKHITSHGSVYSRFLRHSQIFEQLFVLINTKEALWNIQALQYP